MGGLSIDQAIETARMGADAVVFGAPLVISGAEFKSADPNMEKIPGEIASRVKA